MRNEGVLVKGGQARRAFINACIPFNEINLGLDIAMIWTRGFPQDW